MMYEWLDGSSVPWYGMIFGPVMMIAFIVVTVLIIAWVLRAAGLGRQSEFQAGNTPLDTLKHRFARGEIDRVEYEERKKVLS
ncbi:MAG TPA: SHOCT domain-containing protein [Xanthobacteraceae bacterium]|nr:SHOCT domain-containing protein [Xanthobacteraceae bacterium]